MTKEELKQLNALLTKLRASFTEDEELEQPIYIDSIDMVIGFTPDE